MGFITAEQVEQLAAKIPNNWYGAFLSSPSQAVILRKMGPPVPGSLVAANQGDPIRSEPSDRQVAFRAAGHQIQNRSCSSFFALGIVQIMFGPFYIVGLQICLWRGGMTWQVMDRLAAADLKIRDGVLCLFQAQINDTSRVEIIRARAPTSLIALIDIRQARFSVWSSLKANSQARLLYEAASKNAVG